jgi:hypothetical protein
MDKPPSEQCPYCQSQQFTYHPNEGYYECQACHQVWGYAEVDERNEISQIGLDTAQHSITILEMGIGEDGIRRVRFMSTLPGDTKLQNGMTIDQLYQTMANEMAEEGVHLVRD